MLKCLIADVEIILRSLVSLPFGEGNEGGAGMGSEESRKPQAVSHELLAFIISP